MLSVPFPDKKSAAASDPFLPAITGEFQSGRTFYQHHPEQFSTISFIFCFHETIGLEMYVLLSVILLFDISFCYFFSHQP